LKYKEEIKIMKDEQVLMLIIGKNTRLSYLAFFGKRTQQLFDDNLKCIKEIHNINGPSKHPKTKRYLGSLL